MQESRHEMNNSDCNTIQKNFKLCEVTEPPQQADECLLTFVLRWADIELESMRKLKSRIEKEDNLPTRRGLEMHFSARANRYSHIVRQIMFEVKHSELFSTLTPEEKLKVIGWTREGVK